MPKTETKLSRGKSVGTAADRINKLRLAVIANSELLLSDLQLPALGLPVQTVRSRLHDRGARWDRNAAAGSKLAELKMILRNKSGGKSFAVAQGFRVPELYWFGKATEPPDFSKFPQNFVLKPNESHSTKGVIVYKNGCNLILGDKISLEDLPRLMTASGPDLGLPADADWVAEEFIVDVDPQYAIPRDFKFHVGGGRAHIVYAVNRNTGRSKWCTSWYTRDWIRIQDRMNLGRLLGPDMVKPAGYELLLSAVDRLAQSLGIYMRIDFYLTANGPVLGELTPFPDHGLYYTETGELALSQMWSLFPDPVGV